MSFGEDIGALVAANAFGVLSAAPDWSRVPLGSVSRIVNGYPFESKLFGRSDGVQLVRIRDVVGGRSETRYRGPVPKGYSVEDGDLLVGMDGDFNSAFWRGGPAVLNQRVCKIDTDESRLRRKFLGYLLPGYLKLINANTSSITVKHLSSKTLQQLPIPLPDTATQDAILAHVDGLFAEIDEGEQALAAAREGLCSYRKALLNAAVAGGLTAAWRGETPNEEPHRVPVGWQYLRVGQAGRVQLGRQRTPKDHAGPYMRPYLRVANVFEDRISVDDVMSMNFSPSEFKTFALAAEDILLNEGQSLELVGRPAMYHDDVPGCCFQNTLVRFRAGPSVNPDFALIVFLHKFHVGEFQSIAKITTNIAHLGAGRFSELPFPVPPMEEQREIARVFREREVVVREPLATVNSNGLRQSILAAAFRGELAA